MIVAPRTSDFAHSLDTGSSTGSDKRDPRAALHFEDEFERACGIMGTTCREGSGVPMLRISSAVMHEASLENQVQRLKRRSEAEILSLTSEMRGRVRHVLTRLQGRGWRPVVFHGRRTVAQQAEKVRLGYSPTMNSFHVSGTQLHHHRNGMNWDVKGEAADIVDARYLWSGPAESLHFQFWTDLGWIAESLGLTWGGRWKKPDVAHVELTSREFMQDTRGLAA